MRRSLKKLGVAAGAAVAAVAFAAPAATAGVAAPVWTVGPSSPEAFSGSSGTVVFIFNGIPMTCMSSAAKGDLATASGATDVTVGTVAPLTWSNCTSPFGPVAPTADTSTPWKLNANTYSAGVTHGYISGVKLRMTITTCAVTVAGRLAATYSNSTGRLEVTDDSTYKLTVLTATPGCAGYLAVGDTWAYSASYSLVTPVGGTTRPTLVYTP
ncbi:hypothetical protein ACIRD8_32620 [Streptomyces sp. NPDC102451]|uniref:hypothetical protein n=1 Tax=Streptomyces sp. NPDC102451 TaxID=3366177 RepID=UPI00381ABFC6